MTVGKIYVGLIIAENWRAYKSSQSKMNNLKMVSFIEYCIFVLAKKKMFGWKNCPLLLMLKTVKKLMVVLR